MTRKTWFILAGVAVVVTLGAFALSRPSGTTGVSDAFAQCLSEKGVKMWGAYWCPHCQAQKKLFGSSFKYVTSIECGIPGNTSGQTQQCKDAGIKSYPTWEFANGDRLTGEQTFAVLGEKAGCPLAHTNANANAGVNVNAGMNVNENVNAATNGSGNTNS